MEENPSSTPQDCLPFSPEERIGLIAGNGRFPIIFAENAQRLGYRISAVAHQGETEPTLENYVERIHWVKLGQFNRMITALKQDGVRQTVMVGGITKTRIFSQIRPDLRALAVASRLRFLKDDEILRQVAKELESEGIYVRESTFGLQGIVADEGVMTTRQPNKKEWADIEYGWQIARHIGQIDIGQCVVIKDRVVVAVEAIEGTDEAIRRGGTLAQTGAVVVKRSKPQQDLRFDLPAVGPATIEAMESVKASVLAIEAERTVLLDRADMLRRATQAGISIVGVKS